MTEILIATASVHTTAAACDYLENRVGELDTVYVLTVLTETVTRRDAGDAANVARTRLFETAIEPIQKEAAETAKADADIAGTIHDVGEEYEIDEIIVGTTRGSYCRTENLERISTPGGSNIFTNFCPAVSPEHAGEPPGSTVRRLLGLTSRPVVVVHP